MRRVRRITETVAPGRGVRARRAGAAALTALTTLLLIAQLSLTSMALASWAVMERDLATRQPAPTVNESRT